MASSGLLCRGQWGGGTRKPRGNTMKHRSALPCIAALILLVAGVPAMAQTMDKVIAVIPQNSVFVLNWNGAKDAGVFSNHGIDLTVDVRPFAGFLEAVPATEAMATTHSGNDANY